MLAKKKEENVSRLAHACRRANALLSKSGRRKGDMGEKYIIPEVTSNQEWLLLTDRRAHLTTDEEAKIKAKSPHLQPIKAHQLMVIDVFTGWSGPCNAVESHLRRLRHSFVEAPDCLALARARCDEIEELEAFKHDIRPTFLFWARGGPVALLRGANRPLLTRLIQHEVEVESKQGYRPIVEIDFTSPRVIQCGGDLAQLEHDDVVRSIGCGNTDKLSSFYHENSECTKSTSKHDPNKNTANDFDPADIDENHALLNDNDTEDEEELLKVHQEALKKTDISDEEYESNAYSETNEHEMEAEDGLELEGGAQQDSSDALSEEESEPKSDLLLLGAIASASDGANTNPEFEVEESAFGRKIRRRKKKMETRLLKEILSETKLSNKRH